MIKILSTKQIKELDAYTIQHEPIASIDLMERACRAFTLWFTDKFNGLNKVGIVCGTGNNGGDGLGIARMLKECEYPVKVWIVKGQVAESEDFKVNLERLKDRRVEISEITAKPDKNLFNNCDILIDAIFGSGLSRPPEGIYADTIECINQTEAIRVAVDTPSGLMADKPSGEPIVKANCTVSFQLPKLSFLFPQHYDFVGEWTLVDIGLSKSFIKEEQTSNFYLSRNALRKILKPRTRFDHKGNFGHAMIIAGSYGKMGAAVLASKAALRAGVGLLTVHSPRCGYTILQTAVPEAMVSADDHENFFSTIPDLKKIDCTGIGPGLDQKPETVRAFQNFLQSFNQPVVIDADGLNILAANRELFHLIPEGSILTPHPKEFERLVGLWNNDFERLDKQKQLASQLKSAVIVKGAYTAIASPDGNVYFNATGNPGMATGGTGDVLTGMLTGILAQKYSCIQAAILGVFLHGMAGDEAVREKGEDSLMASDIIEFLPLAFRQLKR